MRGAHFTPLPVDTGVEEGHLVPPGVLLDGLLWIEPHGLAVHQGNEELQGVMTLEPRRLVGRYAKGMGVGLGEHVVAVDLFEDLLGNVLSRHAVGEGSSPGTSRLCMATRWSLLGRAKARRISSASEVAHPGHVGYELHHLLLPDDDPAAPFQGPALQRVVVVPLQPRAGNGPRTWKRRSPASRRPA